MVTGKAAALSYGDVIVAPETGALPHLLLKTLLGIGDKTLPRCPVCFFNMHGETLPKRFLTRKKAENTVAP